MQNPPEAPSITRSAYALGVSFEFEQAIEIRGLAESPAASRATRTASVRVDPDELGRRWRLARGTAVRVRELGDGETVHLSIDWSASAGYLLDAPGFARVLVSPDGRELLCEPNPRCSDWEVPVVAQALPLAATLQGLEVLHASGVVMQTGPLEGQAALFTGPQGAGKSSLAAALVARGGVLLGDDTVALELSGAELVVHPSLGPLQLRADEHGRLSSGALQALGPAAPTLGKLGFFAERSDEAASLGGLFLLERSVGGPAVERLREVDPFELLGCTFNLSVRTRERLTRHLDLATTLARSERIYRLRIQPEIDATQLATILQDTLAGL